WLQGGPGYHRTHVAHEVAADQLTAGKIDRDGQRRVADLFLPCSQVLSCLLHGEEAELHDQPAILGHGNEVGGWNHATPRMFPAQQRLEAGDAVVLETHNRLIGERELPPLYGAAQIRFELEAVSADSTESGPERLYPVAAEALCLVHCEFGVFDEVARGGLVRSPGDQADRGGKHDLTLGEGDRRADGAFDRLGDRGYAGRVLFRQKHQRKLIAGEARQG